MEELTLGALLQGLAEVNPMVWLDDKSGDIKPVQSWQQAAAKMDLSQPVKFGRMLCATEFDEQPILDRFGRIIGGILWAKK